MSGVDFQRAQAGALTSDGLKGITVKLGECHGNIEKYLEEDLGEDVPFQRFPILEPIIFSIPWIKRY